MSTPIIDELLASLSNEVLSYFFPGYSRSTTKKKIDVKKFINKPLLSEPSSIGSLFDMTVGGFYDNEGNKERESSIRFRTVEVEVKPEHNIPASPKPTSKTAEFDQEPEVENLELDPKTKSILKEIKAIEDKYGISITELEAVLQYRVKLSRLRITKDWRIILNDFGGKEVKMDTLTKAVFLLYLAHPEGICYKDLSDHRAELEMTYMSISGRCDLLGMKKSIDDLVNPIFSNSINEKVSRVKKAFRDVVDDRIARFYYIDGERGTAKKIALDRSLVSWD